MSQKSGDNKTQAQARELLQEIDKIKGPAELPEWIVKAQTFLVFEAARRCCGGGGVK